MRDYYFCIFLVFLESSKISVLKEWAELVASQLTQISTYAIKCKFEKTMMGKVVFT